MGGPRASGAFKHPLRVEILELHRIEEHPDPAKKMRRILKEYVRRGRGTPGPGQEENSGDPIGDTVQRPEEEE